jgi:hypothetical protein
MNVIKATTIENKPRLIHELQVATVEPGDELPGGKRTAKVKMSNGEELILVSPDWDMWENDLYLP